MTTDYRVKLTVSTPGIVQFEGRNSFRVQIVASDGENVPNELFGFQRTLVDPYTSRTQDEFCFICSPFDLSTYPANEPNPEQTPQFFRKSVIDVLLPSVTMCEDFVVEVRQQVCNLISEMYKLDRLTEWTPTWCLVAPTEVVSSSSEEPPASSDSSSSE